MTTPPAPATIVRRYRDDDDDDWWRVRALLVDTFATAPPSWNWDIRRWDGSRFHRAEGRLPRELAEANWHGIVEPVGTRPDHVRRGLARALLREGLARVRDLGARTASVDTGDAVAANAFYEAFGFTAACRGHTWRKEWPAG